MTQTQHKTSQRTHSRILITGGNSMLGLNTIEAFISRGYSVCALVRHSNKYLDNSGAQIIYGKVTSFDDLKNAANGCTAIIHIAATTDQNQPRLSYYTSVNVVSTEAVCRASLETSAKRVVLVSTSNTIGNGTFARPSDETNAPASPFSDNLYAKSKIIAESKAWESGAEVVIVNPTFMFGKYDTKPSSGAFLKMYHRKRLAFVPLGGKNFVAAADVANLLVDAMERGRVGDRYLAGGENLSFRGFLKEFYNRIGHKTRIIELPNFMFLIAGFFGSIARFIGFRTDISWSNMRILTTQEYYSNHKAVNELQMGRSDVMEAALECYRWMDATKVIKKTLKLKTRLVNILQTPSKNRAAKRATSPAAPRGGCKPR